MEDLRSHWAQDTQLEGFTFKHAQATAVACGENAQAHHVNCFILFHCPADSSGTLHGRLFESDQVYNMSGFSKEKFQFTSGLEQG